MDTGKMLRDKKIMAIAAIVIGAVLMIIMGFIGVYVGYIFQEVKHRPIYIIRSDDTNKDQFDKAK